METIMIKYRYVGAFLFAEKYACEICINKSTSYLTNTILLFNMCFLFLHFICLLTLLLCISIFVDFNPQLKVVKIFYENRLQICNASAANQYKAASYIVQRCSTHWIWIYFALVMLQSLVSRTYVCIYYKYIPMHVL